MCIPPNNPDHGKVVVSLDGLLAMYSCEVGYAISGNLERVCQNNGSAWSGADSTCGKCNKFERARTVKQ